MLTSIRLQPVVSTVRPVFGTAANNVDVFTTKKAEIQAILRQFNWKKENSNPADPVSEGTLPPEDAIPVCIRREYQQAIQELAPNRLSMYVQHQWIGIGEEASDVICYLMTRLAFETGIFTPALTNGFRDDVARLKEPRPEERLRLVAKKAKRLMAAMKPGEKLQPFFPMELFENFQTFNQAMVDFLALCLADHAIRKRHDPVCDSKTPNRVQRKLQEEIEELAQNIRLLKGPAATKKHALFEVMNDITAKFYEPNSGITPQDYQQAWRLLLWIPQYTFDNPMLRLTRLMQFNSWKTAGRLEICLNNPHLKNHEVKQISKPYEKLLEAYYVIENAEQ